jgi:pyridoxal/pyridoxine/pyridoxamine kinase
MSEKKNHFHEKHIFMFVCSNEKLDNHLRTINCDDSKMTPQIFHGFFPSVETMRPVNEAKTKTNLFHRKKSLPRENKLIKIVSLIFSAAR